MKTIIVVLVFAVLASGCDWKKITFTKPDPFDAKCNAACFAPCDDPMIPITADPDSCITSKKVEHIFRETCDVRRDLCAQCIRRAQDAGYIAK